MRVYSLFDRKLREFGPLFLEKNDEVVKRALIDTVNQGSGNLTKYPEDFDLKFLGVFDSERGKITPEDIPVLVCNMRDLFPNGKE